MNKRLLFIILQISILSQFAQAQPLNNWIEAADTAFVQRDYIAALKYYEIALEHENAPQTALQYQRAESARLLSAFTTADTAYQVVLDSPEMAQYPLAIYWSANVKQRLGQYEVAIERYQRFLDIASVEEKYRELATEAIENCSWAINERAETFDVSIERLDSFINSPFSDFGTYLKGDTLYYSSFQFVDKKDKNNPPRVYIKMLQSIDGGPGRPLADAINIPGKHIAHTAFNHEQSRVYYTICDYKDLTEIRCDIYSREVVNDIWGPATKLPINVDSFTTTQPNIGKMIPSGQQVLFFTSDRPGGKGNMDLWYATIEESGDLGDPINLEEVNTPENDITPFYHMPTQKLYFSSEGYQTFGGFDIYVSKRNNQAWGDPQHLNAPINGSYNDLYYFVSNTSQKVYFSSNRPESIYLDDVEEVCCNDIYEIDVKLDLNLLANTFNNLTKEDLEGVTVELYEIKDGVEILVDTKLNLEANEFNFPIELYKKYKLKANRKDFAPVELPLDLTAPALEEKFGSQFDIVMGAASPAFEEDLMAPLYLDPIEVELQALTFNEADDTPLPGCKVSLLELMDGVQILKDSQRNEVNNDFLFPLELNKTYLITAEKPGFESRTDTIRFTQEDVDRLGGKITIELKLRRVSFDDFLPLALFFDNDYPDPRSYRRTSDLNYLDTYSNYYAKKDTFKSEFTADLPDDQSFVVGEQYNNFFERDVRGGQRNLILFSGQLLLFLQQGNSIIIEIKGYASPRADEDYNKRLSQRRIASLRNHFSTYGNGEFVAFLDNGSLQIKESAFGETTSPPGVSDDLYDKKESIYDLVASAERRVEIVEVTTTTKQLTR